MSVVHKYAFNGPFHGSVIERTDLLDMKMRAGQRAPVASLHKGNAPCIVRKKSYIGGLHNASHQVLHVLQWIDMSVVSPFMAPKVGCIEGRLRIHLLVKADLPGWSTGVFVPLPTFIDMARNMVCYFDKVFCPDRCRDDRTSCWLTIA